MSEVFTIDTGRELFKVTGKEYLEYRRMNGTDQKLFLEVLRSCQSSAAGIAPTESTKSALDVQEGGGHYKNIAIQPIQYIHANKIPFAEGCVIKYVTRHRQKNGAEDIKKAIHFLQLLLELEYGVTK